MRDDTRADSEGPKPRGKVKRLAKVQSRRPRRFAVTYDVNGPHVRLGFLWFVALAGALAVGVGALAVLYSATAALAGYQAARCWQPLGRAPNQYVAAGIGGVIGLAALGGPSAVGAAVLASAVAAVVAGFVTPEAREAPLAAMGYTLQCGLFVGLAAAAPTLAYRVDIGAAAALIIFVSVYEMGDYLVGSGSKNAIEGPAGRLRRHRRLRLRPLGRHLRAVPGQRAAGLRGPCRRALPPRPADGIGRPAPLRRPRVGPAPPGFSARPGPRVGRRHLVLHRDHLN